MRAVAGGRGVASGSIDPHMEDMVAGTTQHIHLVTGRIDS